MNRCTECKFFLNNVPPPRRWWQPERRTADALYQFCGHQEARNVVDGRPDYADLQRAVGECGKAGKNWVQK